MSWSKLKLQLESFLAPALNGRVTYCATGYRYFPGKTGICYIAVDNMNVLQMNDKLSLFRWFQSELEIKNDPELRISINEEDLAAVRKSAKGTVPEDRLKVMARSRKITEYAKEMMAAQASLSKSNFITVANKFISTSIEESIESKDIMLNVLALLDRRVGKKRIVTLSEKMSFKHPIVQYFYELRRETL